MTSDTVELEPMCPKKATRRINARSGKLEDSQRVNVALPEFLQGWIQSEDGVKLLAKCRERKELQECSLDPEGESLLLVGSKANIEQATKFLQFNFENLQ